MCFNQLFAVAGNPVLHSKSPLLFNHLFKENNSVSCYSRISVNNVEELLSIFKEIDMTGMNITSPFKEDILPYLYALDDSAKKIQSVNTVLNINGILTGFNTDESGCINALKHYQYNLKNKNCIVLGAGGAARAVVFGLVNENADVTIINRTYKRAKLLADEFGCKAAPINKMEELSERADILISVVNFEGIEKYFSHIKPGMIILDAIYHNSRLIHLNKFKNITYIPGEDWLLYQGLESYKIFTGNNSNLSSCRKVINKTKLFDVPCNLILIGFTGSGKTTIGKKLAKKLNYKFIDTDAVIKEEENMSIKKIFKLKGEKYFRKKEQQVLNKFKTIENCVISTGGGIIRKKSNQILLKKMGIVIWLFSALEICLNRTKINLKPMLSSPGYISMSKVLFEDRNPEYFKLSDLIVSTTGKMSQTVTKIINEYQLIRHDIRKY